MEILKFADTHNMVAFLCKPAESDGFEQIVDFLNAHPIKYALTVNPTIYISCIEQFWSTIKVKTITDKVQLHALVDGKKIIVTESTVRRDLQLEDDEGSAMPTDPHHTPTIIQPSTQPQKTQKPRKPTRKDTQVPQSSVPSENVADEAVHKELGDSLVRAATTASSLEAEQDSGNITKTRSKATPNESSSLGTTSGGGPRCQETMGDTIAQTRFENVSKHSNDSLLARGNTLRSDEDRLKLDELMALCTTLQTRVLDLEKTNTTQQNEINKSSGDEESLGEDASKQGRINPIDADDDITLVSVQDDADKEMFDVDALNGEEVFVAGQNENVVKEVVDAAQVSTVVTTVTITTEEITLAQALAKIDVDHQLAERLQAQEQEELSDAEKATLSQQLLEKRRKHFAAKRVEEKRNKPPTQAQQRKIMCNYLMNMEGCKLKDLKSKGFDSIQEMFDRAFKRVNTFEDFITELVESKEKRAGAEPTQEIVKKQKVEDDKETAELKQCMEIIPDEEEVTIDVIPLAVKSPSIVDWKIHKEGKKNYYQIVRADGKSQMYMIFSHMLKSFSREDLEDLYKLVKAKYKSTRPVEDLDLL
ncbi:hypothetical protein Tco_0657195 [Tanacetum coccineum]|uniref:Xylulose kinase-1 n=1 Tax=Tanacetum coccineum TaxID=301880 RepID=A0ABQ4XAW0_9ASTR